MNPEHTIAQALLRSWPFANGSGRLLDRLYGGLKFSTSSARVTTTDGFEIYVNPNDLIGRHIYLTGQFDRAIADVLCNFSEPGDVLLDVGANIGYVSACFLHNVRQSTVLAVEPQPTVLEFLAKNLPPHRSKIIPFALSDRDGEAWFKTDDANPGAGHLVDGEGDKSTMRVPMISAQSALADVPKLDLIKIDAEGHERTIVTACVDQISRLKPRAIVFEDSAHEALDITKTLSNLGYRTLGIKKTLTSVKLVDGDAHPIRRSFLWDFFIPLADYANVPIQH